MTERSAIALAFLMMACDAGPMTPVVPSLPPKRPPPASRASNAVPETFVVDVAVGYDRTCAVRADGSLHCAGSNEHQALGNKDAYNAYQLFLKRIDSLPPIVEIAMGTTHTCVRDHGNAVHCMGELSPSLRGPVDWFRSIDIEVPWHQAHVYAVTRHGELMRWGWGNGRAGRRVDPEPIAVPKNVVEVAVGFNTCVLVRDGSLWCQHFAPEHVAPKQVPFRRVTGVDHVTAVAVGTAHACVVHDGGKLSCWGHNHSGQLGLGWRSESHVANTPTAVPGIHDAVHVDAAFGTCIAHATGAVSCWGPSIRDDGSLVRGGAGSDRPVVVPGLSNVRRVALGRSHACAVGKDGRMLCWGANEHGQVADGTREDRPFPVEVAWEAPSPPPPTPIDTSVRAVDVVTSDSHACAITSAGELRCWGSNAHGQLGIGSADAETHHLPTSVPGLGEVVRVDVAAGRTCAVSRRGALRCWGDNSFGALGDGTITERHEPVTIARHVSDVSLAYTHSCALRKDGRVVCWGSNVTGALGVAAPHCPEQRVDYARLDEPRRARHHAKVDVTCLLEPTTPVPRVRAKHIAVDDFSSCALQNDGAGVCWGKHGSGKAAEAKVLDAVDIAAGDEHACALRSKGTLACWGAYRSYWRFGPGGAFPVRSRPWVFDAIGLSAGGNTTCAVFENGEAQCWGHLGDIQDDGTAQPQTIRDLPPVKKIALARKHACALARDGSVWCWGYAPHGVLGTPRTWLQRPTPLRW